MKRATNLALFDFDGTITTKETFVDFLRYATPRWRIGIGQILLAPVIIGYTLGWISPSRARQALARVALRGLSADTLRRRGADFAKEVIAARIRPCAAQRIEWHRDRGDTIVVVSASLDVYLEAWCEHAGLAVLCSRLEVRGGRLTGSYRGPDCCGEEKKRRILERYDPESFASVYAYGDTSEDDAMLGLADTRYFRGTLMRSQP